MGKIDEIVAGLVLELRRGTVVMSVLSQLETPRYGYSLVQSLEARGMPVDAGTLYPLLRRLEKQDLLKSEWEVADAARPRRYYVLSETGKEVYRRMRAEWDALANNMNDLMSDKKSDEGGH